MVEIKFLKELPVRSLNKSELIKLNGADIYVDKDANRFAFFGFKNYLRSPMFSLYLVIKQYDSFGSFIKETRFSLPSIYAKHGNYVIEKPVRISDECEGCEVYIAYAEFATKQFYQDKLINKSRLSDFTKDYFAGAPTSVSCSINSNIVIQKEEPKVEAKKVEEEHKFVAPEAKAEEASVVSEASVGDVKVEEAKSEVEKPDFTLASEEESVASDKAVVFSYRKRLSFVNFIILGGAAAIFAILAIVLNAIF